MAPALKRHLKTLLDRNGKVVHAITKEKENVMYISVRRSYAKMTISASHGGGEFGPYRPTHLAPSLLAALVSSGASPPLPRARLFHRGGATREARLFFAGTSSGNRNPSQNCCSCRHLFGTDLDATPPQGNFERFPVNFK
jgi:hypothetical protein